jgi:hypothetical protein
VSSVNRPRWTAAAIAEAQIADLGGGSRDVLIGLIGNPRFELVMAEDGQAYQVTTVVLAQPDGSLRLHVSVDNSGWSAAVFVVRTANLPAGQPPPGIAR